MQENLGINLLMKSLLESENGSSLFPDVSQMDIPVKWKHKVDAILKAEEYQTGPWMFKSSRLAQTWPIWNYHYPNARWIIVRRKTPDVIHSCLKTGYMKAFKNPANLSAVGAKTEEEGWLWWVHQYEKQFVAMIEAGVDCKQVWPERMVRGDYQQIYQTLEWLGLEWNSKIVETIDPMLIKSRRKNKWQESPQQK